MLFEADIFASAALFDKTYITALGKNWRLQRCLLDIKYLSELHYVIVAF